MATICENCRKEGAERPQPYPNSVESGHEVMNSLEIAAADGHSECLRAIINSAADVNYINKENGYTPIVWAAKYGQHECMDMLIKAGADVNITLCGNYSALMCASDYEGNARCVKLLTETGADVNRKTRYGGTALMTAACYGNTEVVKELIEAGADVNATNNEELTPLAYCAITPLGWKCVDLHLLRQEQM